MLLNYVTCRKLSELYATVKQVDGMKLIQPVPLTAPSMEHVLYKRN